MRKNFIHIRKGQILATILGLVWLGLLTFSFIRNSIVTDGDIYSLALNEARAHFNEDVRYAEWATLEGEVYIYTSGKTQPDYNKVSHRDYKTYDEQRLTPLNPAYMTRLVNEIGTENKTVKGHITSLKPIRQENKAFEWEQIALHSFEKGIKEYNSTQSENGNLVFRYMGPLIIKESCLKCHSNQGYKVGDIRGGISISFPYKSFSSIAASQKSTDLLYHLVAALIGLSGLYIVTRLSEKHKRELNNEKNKLLQNIQRFHLFSEVAKEGLIIHENGIIGEVNIGLSKITGYSREELIGKHIIYNLINPDDFEQALEKLHSKYEKPYELSILKKDGAKTPVEIHGYNITLGEKEIRVVSVRDLSLQKLLENDLRASEERWRSIIKTSPDGIAITSMDGIIKQVSDKAYQMYGYDIPEEVTGRNILEFIEPEYHQKANFLLAEMLKGNYTGAAEYLAIKKDGSRFYVEINAEILCNKAGIPTNLFFIERDITERKRYEEKLKSDRENFRNFFSTIDDMIFIADQQGKIFFTNNAVTEKLGYSIEELNEMHVLDVHLVYQREEAQQIFADMFASKRKVCPLPLGRKDGSALPVETRIWFGKWDDKDCIFGISKDLSVEQEALQKFNKIFEHNPVLMAISSLPDRKFTEVNLTFLKKLDYSSEEVIGKTADELNLFIEPDKQSKIAEILLKKERFHDFELQIKTKHDKILNGMFYGELIESQGKTFFLTLMIDITERKKMEERLLNKRRRLISIINGTNTGTWEWNVQTGETIFNERWAEIVGYTLDELKPISIKIWELLAHPDDLKKSGELLVRHFNKELPYYDFECRMKHKNGNWVWVHDRGQVVTWTNDGKPLMMFGTHSDITERKNMEEKLRESEESVKLIINNSPIGIFYCDNKGKLTFCNSAFSNIIGTPKEKLVGLDLNLLPDSTVVKATLKTLTGEPTYFENIYTSVTSGKEGYLRAFFTPVFSKENTVVGAIVMVEDFSEWKKMEEQIRNYTQELERINSEKDKFFSIIAHDLRSPFQGFLGLTELVASGIDNFSFHDLARLLNEINSKAKNLFALLKNLLEWSKMQRGLSTFNPVELYLKLLTVKSIDSVLQLAEKKNIGIINAIEEDLKVIADENMINSIINNLISNAIKFTGKGGEIKVSSRRTENKMAEVTIEDNGIGMSKNILDNLFKIHEKVGRLGTDGEESSGLGLLLCKDFIEKHNGKIWAESTVSKGSKFIFTIPLAAGF